MNKQLEKQLLKCTSIIHTEDIYGNKEQATCFFLKRVYQNREHHYLITNAHVLQNKTCFHIYLDRLNKISGECSYHRKITLSPNNAVKYHPECDLALLNIDSIMRLNNGDSSYLYEPIDATLIPGNYDIFSHLEPILMLGYPSGIHDTTTNLPIVRNGITATPISSLYKGRPEFLINIPFLNGSSGSPIFAYTDNRFYLIGIEYSKLLEKITIDETKNRLYHSRKRTKEIETGLGIAIRSDQILDLLSF